MGINFTYTYMYVFGISTTTKVRLGSQKTQKMCLPEEVTIATVGCSSAFYSKSDGTQTSNMTLLITLLKI